MPMCIDESRLIRLAADELTAAERATLSAHLQACASCRERYRAIQATWDLLGQWQVAPPERDLTQAVQAAAGKQPTTWRWSQFGRVAAAIALAAVAGTAAGLLTPPRAHYASAPQEVSAEEVAEAIGLDALGGTEALSELFTEEPGTAGATPEAHS